MVKLMNEIRIVFIGMAFLFVTTANAQKQIENLKDLGWETIWTKHLMMGHTTITMAATNLLSALYRASRRINRIWQSTS
jgi:hypothetical protein